MDFIIYIKRLQTVLAIERNIIGESYPAGFYPAFIVLFRLL